MSKKTLQNKIERLSAEIEKLNRDIAEHDSIIGMSNIPQAVLNQHILEKHKLVGRLHETQNELKDATNTLETKYVTDAIRTQNAVESSLKNFNAYYISSESNWYCIYSEPNRRHQPKVTVVSTPTMKDMVYNHTGWYAERDIDLKKIARDTKRMFCDVERTFLPPSPNTLNQMNELRKYWLKPIPCDSYHEAFDYLFENLVGSNMEYKEQVERYIAYSYVRPEDIFAPNIDSSARGGAGRDTVFRILEIIFTEECCGEAKKETVQGTHNGELWGKVWVKISESNNRVMDINELKNLTGGHNFRLRRMGENAVQVPRTFRFFMMSNNYEGTARLTGSGSSAEDRRWEPVFSKTSLLELITVGKNLDINAPEASEILQDWQINVYQNEEEIAKWLYCIIKKYIPDDLSQLQKLRPLHGIYYKEMLERQKNGFNTFMERIVELSVKSNCYDVEKLFKIYKVIYPDKLQKDDFAKRACDWFLKHKYREYEIKIMDIYRDVKDNFTQRMRRKVILPKEYSASDGRPSDGTTPTKLVFDIFDYINEDDDQGFTCVDEKGTPLKDKPHPNNIKPELF